MARLTVKEYANKVIKPELKKALKSGDKKAYREVQVTHAKYLIGLGYSYRVAGRAVNSSGDSIKKILDGYEMPGYASTGVPDNIKQEIIDLYSQGKTYREIADKIGASPATVRRHVIEGGVYRDRHQGISKYEIVANYLSEVRELGATAMRHQERVAILKRYIDMMLERGYSNVTITSSLGIATSTLERYLTTGVLTSKVKWSAEDIDIVRKMRAEHKTHGQIAQAFGVSRSSISNVIVSRKI